MKCRKTTINGHAACRFCGNTAACAKPKAWLRDLLIVCAVGAAWGFLIAWGVGL